MKKYVLVLLSFTVGFFVAGVLWGIWSLQLRDQRIARSTPLRVLCGENWLSAQTLEKFSLEHNVRIEQYTYAHPSDFLRQMANADGKVDVICTSSLLVRSLTRSRWLRKADFASLANVKFLAVDFTHLPYDPDLQYTVPLFWNLYGFFGKGDLPKVTTWKQTWLNKKISLWGEELNLLHLMNSLHLNSGERLVAEQTSEGIGLAFQKFTKSTVRFLKPETTPIAAEAMIANADWIQLPLGRVARLLGRDSPYRFWLPEDGATVEVGVLAIGERSAQPELARVLINDLLATDEALKTHQQLDTGVVHASLSGLSSITELQKPEALRQFPLNRLRFPDLDVQELPSFQKAFDGF